MPLCGLFAWVDTFHSQTVIHIFSLNHPPLLPLHLLSFFFSLPCYLPFHILPYIIVAGAYWDGKQFITRAGNVIVGAPGWFTGVLPADMCLGGELFCRQGKFSDTSSIVRTEGNANHPRWRKVV